MYTFIDRAEFTTGWYPFNTTEWGQRGTQWRLQPPQAQPQQRAGLRQSRRGRRQPRPAEWCHWCSLPSATNDSPRCLSSSASWLPPLPSSFWGLSAGPGHRTCHRPAWSILFSPQKLLCLGKGIKGLLDTEAGGTRKDFQRSYQAMTHLPLCTQLPVFLFAGIKMVQIKVWINVINYKMMLIVGFYIMYSGGIFYLFWAQRKYILISDTQNQTRNNSLWERNVNYWLGDCDMWRMWKTHLSTRETRICLLHHWKQWVWHDLRVYWLHLEIPRLHNRSGHVARIGLFSPWSRAASEQHFQGLRSDAAESNHSTDLATKSGCPPRELILSSEPRCGIKGEQTWVRIPGLWLNRYEIKPTVFSAPWSETTALPSPAQYQ